MSILNRWHKIGTNFRFAFNTLCHDEALNNCVLIVYKQETLITFVISVFCSVVLPGLEPRQAEPKTAVLPLHHKTILIAPRLTS